MFAIFALLFSIVFASDKSLNRTDLKCTGFAIHNVSLTAYYPVFETDDTRDYLDDQGDELKTLQDYLDGRAHYVTVAGNLKSGIPYRTKICIEKLNEYFGKQIPLQIRDQNDYKNDKLIDFSRLEICVRTEEDTYDNHLNDFVTIYIL
ncbi:hypothetical protein ALC56_03304 [Trachymyrmex septentrionalis]|uniref:Uncharacterized protein n=2 Tax=Trachymyrmex septentrionalis TaxID=34720 RepID=A0A195FP27_9HYME|nr:hypothetical protein ALC56_03304 [Trachymyrmex septentrionalis]